MSPATATTTEALLSAAQLADWQRDGYLIVRGVFSADEIAALAARFAELAAGPAIPDHWDAKPDSPDPLQRFPRMTQPHRFDALSKAMLLHPRVGAILRQLLGEEAWAVQSMYYFKPTGARGQALHQDDFYLQTKPRPCIAAWTAVDPSLPENGGLFVVPGTGDLDLACPGLAEEGESFTTHFVRPPAGKTAIPARLQPGDTLFFGGKVIHGSQPNRHPTLWRRSFICHYVPASSRSLAQWFHPVLNFAGEACPLAIGQDGGPCGEAFTPFWASLSEEERRRRATSF
jgi:phytanoyl-CoA hydroxylase